MSPEALLRTGEAAARLGVSRQHIVDLCKQGKLPCIVVGTHRRIPESAVTARIGAATGQATRGDTTQRSLWLHAALVAHLINDPDTVIGKARANLAQARATGAVDVHSAPYAEEWETILDAGVGRIIAVLLDPSDHAATLRSSSPFAGVLCPNEVRAIKKAWRHERDRALPLSPAIRATFDRQ